MTPRKWRRKNESRKTIRKNETAYMMSEVKNPPRTAFDFSL